MKLPYEDLYYLKARGPDDKRPAEEWGGYGQDFEDASCIYTHEEVEMLPHKHWLTNSVQNQPNMSMQLLVFDIDIHKAPDGFDNNRLGVPTDTPLVRSQSGGYHLYFIVNTPARGQESDFEVVADLPFDIDIRGEFVKHHVVAPSDIPGVGGGYEIVNDDTIKHVFNPKDAAKLITFDGDPAISYKPGKSRGGSGYERENFDPPDNMPKCYGAGLTLRKEAPEDHENTHKVNLLAALAGLGAGYSVETVVEHFVDDYYPGDPSNADQEKTEYQVGHIAEKMDRGDYDPPSVETLQEYDILPGDEWCYCGLPGHDKAREQRSAYYRHDLGNIARANAIDGNPYEDNLALLEACLHAREEVPELDGEKPPYGAVVAVAETMNLPVEEPEEQILGQTTYKVARRMYDDLTPDEVEA